MIVKHRRGTTKEWRENNIIPEAGELVIEECSDGTRRCKLGTGYQYFSDLPYIDDKLWEEIDSTKTDLNTKITNLDKRLSREAKEVKNSLRDQLATEVAIRNEAIKKLADDAITADEARLKLMQESDKKLQKDIKAAADELRTSIESLDAKTSAGVGGLKSQLANIDNTITGKFINHTALFDKKLDTAVDDIVDDYNTKITELTKTLQATSAELAEIVAQTDENKEVIADFSRDALNKIDAIKAALKAQIAVQAARIDNLIMPSEGEPITDADIIDELEDLKIDHKGNRHGSAGTAVRSAVEAVEEDVQELRDSLASYIDTDAINGLYYDIEGNIGLGQPYMLYLKTSNGEVLQDTGVQIVGGAGGGTGGGSSSSSSLKISYITKDAITITSPEDAKLSFLFSGVDSSGDTLSQANAQWKVNGTTVARGIVYDGENTFDVSNYVRENDTIKVLLIVTDDNGSVITKTWSIQYVVLRIASDFNDKEKYTVGEEIPFIYKAEGALKKTAVFKLNGEEIGRQELAASISGFDRGNITYALPAYDNNNELREHGSYLLEVYLEAIINGDRVTSKSHVVKDLIWYDATKVEASPIIGVATQHITVKQYETAEIVYTVYDPANINTPKVEVYVDTGNDPVASLTLEPNKDYGYTPTGVYTYATAEVGTHIIKIICGKTEKVITIVVDSLGVNIAPVTTGLVFDFHPIGISNDDAKKREWAWNYDDVHMSVSDNFDWKNGGYQTEKDENGNSIPGTEHFCIKAGSTATIDYKLFADEAKTAGKEVKLIFKTKHVADPEATFLSCVDNTTAQDYVGIQMGVHQANIYGKNGKLDLEYSEEDIIEFEFNISNDKEAVPMVMGYEDGVPSRPMVYDSTYSFKQATAKEITLGSPHCDLLIYRFKVYNRSLAANEILDNFIADARTANEMISRFNRNQIYTEGGKLDPDVLAEKCPWLRVYKLSAPHFTNNKSNKVKNTTIQQIYKDGDPILDNWICHNAQHSGQGTSSNNYGAAGRNLDFIMNKDGAYFELGDGNTASTITLTRESVPVAYLNAKVNIASSNNITNALLANRYNRFNPYKRPFVARDGVNVNFIKDTMEFHNCVIFIQETDPDLSTHREFADTDWHFYAIGNIGDSKKTDNTRATDPSDKYECCVEIMDVGLPLADFPRETIREAMAFEIDTETGNRVYKWATDKNLEKGILLEKDAEGNYVQATGGSVDVENKTYYMDFLLNDDFSEDYTYGWRYLWEDGTDEENEEVFNHCKQKWIEFYQFVTTSTDEEFKAGLKDYFVVDSALYYYLFTTRYCMVDNRAKNTFWHYGKAADGSYKWDLCWDYDNDTSLGLNNYGKQVYRYGLEDTDQDANGVEVFRESDSTFFCRVRDLFADKLQEMYETLEGQNAWHAESLINECDAWQNEFPEELWHLDINRKYIRTYNSSFINKAGDKQFLTNMCNGKMKYHRRQWERDQEMYMASKYQTSRALGSSYHANFRVNRFDSTEGMAVTPNYQFTITPYSHVYLNIQYGGTKPIQVRANPNVATPIPFSGALAADIINVGSAAAIRDFGDLSALYPNTVSIQNATRVKTLTLGTNTEGYAPYTKFASIETGNNALLEEINLTNTLFEADVSKTLNYETLLNLKRFYAFGTNLTSVLFADGGKLADVELPAVNSITLKNLHDLSSANLKLENNNYSNVVDLIVENCPLIDAIELFNKCTKVNRVRLVGVNFGTTTYDEFIAKWGSKKGITASGDDIENAALAGTVRFNELTGAQFSDLRYRYPDLAIEYDYLQSKLMFTDADGTILTDLEQPIENGANGSAPAFTPTKEADIQYEYVHLGWSMTPNIILTENEAFDEDLYTKEVFEKVEGDRILYPVFRAKTRVYEVIFKSGEQALATIQVPYSQNAGTYYINNGYETPKYAASSAIDVLYEFIGWHGKLGTITDITTELIQEYGNDPITFEAQFNLPDQDRNPDGTPDADDLPGYTLGLNDISYTTSSDNTLAITECKNIFNTIVKVPEKLANEGKEYTVTGIGGFSGCTDLRLIYLPDTLKTMKEATFANCSNLLEVDMQNCEISLLNKVFYRCSSLANVILPKNGLTTIRNGCFSGCTVLSNIELPNTLTTIGTYSFNGSGLTEISIPASINSLSEHAFGEMTKLTKVIFNNRANNTTKLPTIHHKAFEGSGAVNFEVPWSLEEHLSAYVGTYEDVRDNVLNKDIFFGAVVGSTITFVDGTVITKESSVEDGNRFKEG